MGSEDVPSALVGVYVPQGSVVMEAGRPAEYWPIALLAGFSRLQELIRQCLTLVLKQHGSNAMADELTRKHFSRLTDADRLAYLKALARDSGHESKISSISDVFWRCKRVRDVIAHQEYLELLYEPRLEVHCFNIAPERMKGIPSPLTPAALRLLVANCRWLEAQVCWLAQQAGVPVISPVGHRHPDGTVHSAKVRLVDPGPPADDSEWQNPPFIPLPCDTAGCPVPQPVE